jgi:hypothetical protein
METKKMRVGYGDRIDEIFVQPGYMHKIQVCTQDGRFLWGYDGAVEQGVQGGYFAKFKSGKRSARYVEVIPVYGDHDFQVTVRCY